VSPPTPLFISSVLIESVSSCTSFSSVDLEEPFTSFTRPGSKPSSHKQSEVVRVEREPSVHLVDPRRPLMSRIRSLLLVLMDRLLLLVLLLRRHMMRVGFQRDISTDLLPSASRAELLPRRNKSPITNDDFPI
jgi:hypothetical protein